MVKRSIHPGGKKMLTFVKHVISLLAYGYLYVCEEKQLLSYLL
jgi:hypothetical protein